jgi:urease alpha subunit
VRKTVNFMNFISPQARDLSAALPAARPAPFRQRFAAVSTARTGTFVTFAPLPQPQPGKYFFGGATGFRKLRD